MSISPADFQQTLNQHLDFYRVYLFQVKFYYATSVGTPAADPFVTNLIASTETPVSSSTQIGVGWMGSKLKVAGKTDFQDWKVTVRDDITNVAYNFFQTWREDVYKYQDGSSQSLQNIGYKRSADVILISNGSASGKSLTIGKNVLSGLVNTMEGKLPVSMSNLLPSIPPSINKMFPKLPFSQPSITISDKEITSSRQRIYKLAGIWPKDIGAVSLDYATEGIVTFPVTFSIDYFTVENPEAITNKVKKLEVEAKIKGFPINIRKKF
jgi:hypothetical protein